jgi:hypothetical protein
MAFVLIEKFSTEILKYPNNPNYQLLNFWHEIENFNSFLKNLESDDLITIDLN